MEKTHYSWVVILCLVAIAYFSFKALFPGVTTAPVQEDTRPPLATFMTEPTQTQVIKPISDRTSCLQKVETDYAQNWKTACNEAYTDLQKFLDNCSLPQAYEDQVDNERLQGMSDCYSTYSQ